MRSPRPSSLVLLALPLTALFACDREEEAPEEVARLVEVGTVASGDAVDRLVLLGDVHGAVEVRVFPQLPETVRQVHVSEGQAVSAGDPIVTLASDLSASEVGQADAALLAAEAQRDQVSTELDRIRPLVAREVLASSRLETLEVQLRAAEAQVAQLRAARQAAGSRRARTVVRAPTDGVVALLTVEEGDLVAPQMPLCAVVQMDRVEVRLRVVEPDYVRLEEGMPVTVTPPSLPDLHRDGTITEISPVLDPIARTASVTIALDNADHALRPGMVADVAIELARREGVTMVPARAVLMTTRTESESAGQVFVVERDVAHRREVVLGTRYGDEMEIISGLAPGEVVVTMGQHLLRDGGKVRVADPAPAEPVARARSTEREREREGGGDAP